MATQQLSDVVGTGTWRIDPTTTTVTVAAKMLSAFTVVAGLTVTAGTITLGSDDSAQFDVTVDAGSYTSKLAMRNNHVRGADFLDAEHYPTIRFTGGTLTPEGGGQYRVAGEVTVKGRTSPIEFTVTDIEASEQEASFKATAIVNRTEIGVDKMPSFMIGQTLTIAVSAHTVR